MTGLSEYPLRFAACRDLGHAWFYLEWRNGTRAVRCQQCHTERKDTLSSAFRVMKRRYNYPKGYTVSGQLRIEAALEVRARLARLAKTQHIRWAVA